jgi:dCMP deaminase
MKNNRPGWIDYFMSIATIVSFRSIDPSTKVGCVIVNQENSILSTGYNGPPRGMLDENVPTERPEKYSFFSHAEINAIANAARHGTSLRNSTFYVTTPPCDVCFRSVINSGAVKLIYGPVNTSEKDRYNFTVTERMAKECGVELISYEKLTGNKTRFLEMLEEEIRKTKNKIEKN